METIILILILFLTLVAVILACSLLIGLIQTRGVPFISVPKQDFERILSVMDLKSGQTICDLGCGKAHFLIFAVKKTNSRGVGYELSLWPYLWAKINTWLQRASVKIYFKNFFQADLSQAQVIFCYLFPEVMAKLEIKFQKELMAGSRVVAYGFGLPNIKPVKILNTDQESEGPIKIFIYQF